MHPFLINFVLHFFFIDYIFVIVSTDTLLCYCELIKNTMKTILKTIFSVGVRIDIITNIFLLTSYWGQ